MGDRKSMKWRIIFLSGLFLGFALQSVGQTHVGFSYGYSSSQYKYIPRAGRPTVRTEGIFSPTYALILEHFSSKSTGIRLELQRINLGYTQTDTLGRTNQTQFDYFKVPLLANIAFGNSGKFHIKAGTHFGYLMKAQDLQRSYEGIGLLPTYGGSEDKPSSFLYGIILGTGVSKRWGIHTIAADARYSYDFNRVERQERLFDMNSTNIEFSLSYLVRIIPPRW
jgi:hypothetical protein